MPNKSMNINIVNKIPAHITDGHQIFINDRTGETSIMFFQIFPTPTGKDDILDASMTSHIRMSFEQAEKLCEILKKGLDSYKKDK